MTVGSGTGCVYTTRVQLALGEVPQFERLRLNTTDIRRELRCAQAGRNGLGEGIILKRSPIANGRET